MAGQLRSDDQWIVAGADQQRRYVGSRAEAELATTEMDQLAFDADLGPPDAVGDLYTSPVPIDEVQADGDRPLQEIPDPLDHLAGWMLTRHASDCHPTAVRASQLDVATRGGRLFSRFGARRDGRGGRSVPG